MPGFLLTPTAQVKCGHGGPCQLPIIAARVSMGGLTAISGMTNVPCPGCPNQMATITPIGAPGPVLPNPCTVAPKIGTSCVTTRVTSMGQPLAIQGPGPASDGPVPLALPAPPPPLAPVTPPVPLPLMPIASAGQTRVFAM